MASWTKPLLQLSDPFAIIVDVCLIVAIVAAYLPQIRHLRKATTGEEPSIEGLSPIYIFSHGVFCNSQLSFALFTLWNADTPTKLSTLDSKLCVAQLFAQWICAMITIAIYTTGKSKKLGGKFTVPSLVYMHAFFFVFVPLKVINEPEESSSYLDSQMIGALLVFLAVLSMPLILLQQFCAQYWELRKMIDYGALSPRSCCIQAAVMAIMALRHFIRMGVNFEDIYGWKTLSFVWALLWGKLPNVLTIYTTGFLSINFVLWIGGAAIIYFATRASKTCTAEKYVELGVVWH